MITQGQTRAAVLACLILIVVLLALNLRHTAVQTFVNTQAIFPEKDSGMTGTGPADQEPAYNKDLQKLRQKGLSASLQNIDLNKLSSEQLLLTIHSYLDNNEIVCRRKLRMGNMGDGGWEICDDPDVRPRPPCIIYSFGISNDFSFDDDAAKVYGCHVYSFDPSMTKYADHVVRSPLTSFYKIGLSEKSMTDSRQWKLKTLSDIRTMLGHNNVTIDIIKMDIESSEWPSLPEMIKSGQLKTVRQLMVEYHLVADSQGYLLPRLQVIQAIEKAGFKRYYVHKNPACVRNIPGYPIARTSCYEIHYIRRVPKVKCPNEENWVFVENGVFRISNWASQKYGKITCEYAPIVREKGDYSARHA